MTFESEGTPMVEGLPVGLLRRFAALVVAEMAVQEAAMLGTMPADPVREEQATLRAMMIAVPG